MPFVYFHTKEEPKEEDCLVYWVTKSHVREAITDRLDRPATDEEVDLITELYESCDLSEFDEMINYLVEENILNKERANA